MFIIYCSESTTKIDITWKVHVKKYVMCTQLMLDGNKRVLLITQGRRVVRDFNPLHTKEAWYGISNPASCICDLALYTDHL